jgi:NADH-quinone oxidoreductase subunit G
MIVLGQGALTRGDGAAVLAAAWALADKVGALTADWHGFNVLHTAASRVAALDLGFLPGADGLGLDGMLGGGVDVLWLLGADALDTKRIGAETFVVYQGHHGDAGAARADVILPGSAYTEKNGTYVNTEGRVQRGYRALFAPGEAREDWRIIRAFSDVLGKALPYDDLDGVRAHLERANPVFAREGLPRFGAGDRTGPAAGDVALSGTPFLPAISDYYQTNSISRASLTMAECSRQYGAPTAIAAE